MMKKVAVAALGLALATAACGGASEGPRIHDRPGFGYRVPLAAGWVVLGEVVKSRRNSQLSFQVHSLEDAERKFMEGFPDSLIPQLEEWAKTSFGVVGAPERKSVMLGGLEALELAYPVSARAELEPGKLIYWVVRREDWLYILRATIPVGAPASDEADLRLMAAGIELFEPGFPNG